MADLRISELRQIQESEVQALDEYAIADRSNNETRKIRADDLAKSSIRLLPDGSISSDKVDLSGVLPTYGRGINKDASDVVGHDHAAITPGTRSGITYNEYGHITAAEADKPFARGIDEGANDIGHTNSIVAGTRLGITYDEFGHVSSALPDKEFGFGIVEGIDTIGHINLITPGEHAGFTYDEHGHITAVTGTIPADDLPIATTTELGAVYVPVDGGLTVSGAGAISHSFTTTPNTTGAAKVTYDQFGHVTGSVNLDATDLPLATETTPGAVIVPTTSPLQVDGAGNITHSQVGAAGDYTKVTVDSYGHVTSGSSS